MNSVLHYTLNLKLFVKRRKLKSHSTMRGRLWAAFHKVAMCDLPPVWDNIFSSLGLECKDKLICQSTNEKVFNMLIVSVNSYLKRAQRAQPAVEKLWFLISKCTSVRWGPHALLKRFESHGKRYEKYFECLGDMSVGSGSSDFLEYTKEWMSRVNRGGLFPLNNQTFLLFSEIERTARTLLASRILDYHDYHTR